MMKLTIALMFAFLSATAVHAEIYNYSCKVAGKTYPLRVDDKTNILEWRGKKYSITVSSWDDDGDDAACAKYGWVVKGNGESFKFCTATQGVGDLEDKDGKTVAECCERRGKCNFWGNR